MNNMIEQIKVERIDQIYLDPRKIIIKEFCPYTETNRSVWEDTVNFSEMNKMILNQVVFFDD